MIKIYESNSSIVYRGFNKKIIDEHIHDKTQKILYVYDTKENLLCDELSYESNYLAFYEILTETSDEFIIKRHIKLDEGTVEWKPIAGIKRGWKREFDKEFIEGCKKHWNK